MAKVSELLRREGLLGVHVGSIATAQGSEWDYVILSTVRSERGGRLGLLADPHTMNVAITRARHGMVVLCDEVALQEDSNWSALLKHARDQKLIIAKEPDVLKPQGISRPLTDEEAFDEEQEKLATLLQSLLCEPKAVEKEKDEKETPEKTEKSRSRRPSSRSKSSRSSRSKSSSSRSRSPRGSLGSGSNSEKPQKRPINALFFHDERVTGA